MVAQTALHDFTVSVGGGTGPGSFTLTANAYCNTMFPVAPAVRLTTVPKETGGLAAARIVFTAR
ncbi:MAG TPA: hypothetical protein VER58_13420 [Thermoanaerobaculia bacterium]|nr:hypothetical protein [Thermoanaerobaculia bacterium]